MNKGKALICTALFVIVITIILTATFFIKSEQLGISLYQIIIGVIANIWLGNSIVKFYNWLKKDDNVEDCNNEDN